MRGDSVGDMAYDPLPIAVFRPPGPSSYSDGPFFLPPRSCDRPTRCAPYGADFGVSFTGGKDILFVGALEHLAGVGKGDAHRMKNRVMIPPVIGKHRTPQRKKEGRTPASVRPLNLSVVRFGVAPSGPTCVISENGGYTPHRRDVMYAVQDVARCPLFRKMPVKKKQDISCTPKRRPLLVLRQRVKPCGNSPGPIRRSTKFSKSFRPATDRKTRQIGQ